MEVVRDVITWKRVRKSIAEAGKSQQDKQPEPVGSKPSKSKLRDSTDLFINELLPQAATHR
jgi:hypothetical protein